jgi:hypothetical protein
VRDPAVLAIESRVGHPGEKWDALKERIQEETVRRFADVQDDWLALMWCLDQYRRADVPPRDMGKQTVAAGPRLEAIYRGKGNWFAEAVALILQNRTAQRIAPRQRVQGFSQRHQIDLAWPAREEDVRVCAETKVTGAPATATKPARRSRSDYSNRRKELKFGATDLKLYRRQDETVIRHWGVWRESAPPRTYFLWAARLERPHESISTLVREAKALVETYLDGAGIFGWQENDDQTGYESVPLQPEHTVTTLDDVLHRISTVIAQEVGPQGEPPDVIRPTKRAIPPGQLPSR